MSAGANAALLVFLIIVAGEGSTVDRIALEFVGQLPGWLLCPRRAGPRLLGDATVEPHLACCLGGGTGDRAWRP